jgi:hypothetical protein
MRSCKCEFPTEEAEIGAKLNILKDSRLGLPVNALVDALKDDLKDNWAMRCDCADKSKIISAVHYKQNDWYLCTMKNAITREGYGGKGLGTEVSQELFDKLEKDTDCLVYAGDVDLSNIPSRKLWENLDFEAKIPFTYANGVPADIFYYMLKKPIE